MAAVRELMVLISGDSLFKNECGSDLAILPASTGQMP
jgi:hypothetical protein